MSGGTPDGTRVSDYDYSLPEGRIARYPADRRDESRLLVVPGRDRSGRAPDFRHLHFREVAELFRPGDLLVVNESRVLPARLLGRKPTGAPAEILLLRPWVGAGTSTGDARDAGDDRGAGAAEAVARPPTGPGALPAVPGAPAGPEEMAAAADRARVWEALVRPGSKLKPGRRVVISDDLAVDILDSVPGGGRVVRLDTPLSTAEALERYGHMPLPPYIGRDDEVLDRERYQTVYARAPGSIAAPTAGLHFTPELLRELEGKGVRRTAVTLHVGIGTFRPVEVEDPAEHEMHAELYVVPEATVHAVDETRARGGRVWAVGTTVVRTLETVAVGEGRIRSGSGATRLFIRPPGELRVVDGLITNFHLPRSTLLMLVAAVAGYERAMEAYREAVRAGYRFYSYGDAMAVTPG